MTREVAVTTGYSPGVIADVIGLHMAYYAPAWGFGSQFEGKLAREMGEFHERLDPARDLFAVARDSAGVLVGSITIDGISAATVGAHLRWFIVDQRVAGSGIGGALMSSACRFLDARAYRLTYLTTFRGLDAARALYERFGFRLVEEQEQDPWSGSVGVQRFERRIP